MLDLALLRLLEAFYFPKEEIQSEAIILCFSWRVKSIRYLCVQQLNLKIDDR